MGRRGETGRSDDGPGWIATILGMAVLVAAGFIVGLIVGVISEEPTLVVGHLVGHDEELPWSPDAEPVTPEPPTQEPAMGWRQALSEAGEESGSTASAPIWEELSTHVPEVAAGPPAAVAGGFVVQVGAFSERASAEELSRALAAKGHAAYVAPSPGSGNRRWRVRVGPAVNRDEAQQLARRLKLEERLPTWVVSREEE